MGLKRVPAGTDYFATAGRLVEGDIYVERVRKGLFR